MSRDIFGYEDWEWELPASRRWRPRMLLNTPQCTPPRKNYVSPNVKQHILKEVQAPRGDSPLLQVGSEGSEV